MAGLAHGWNSDELLRAAGELFLGLSALSVDSVPTMDFGTLTPDATANPDGESVGYTAEGWNFVTRPTFEGQRVDEEQEDVSTYISANEVTLSATLRQVKNLSRLARITPGSVYHAAAGGQPEKLTGGGLNTFDYTTAMLIVPDPNDEDVVWAAGLYRCVNTAGLEMGFGRTKDTGVNVTLTGYVDSSRSAGDRTWFLVKYVAP